MLKSSKLVFLLRKAAQNILSPVSHKKKQNKKRTKQKQQKKTLLKIKNNNYKYTFINRSKSTDNNQHFLSHDTEHKNSYKQNKQKNGSTQRNYENSFLVADRISIRVTTNLSLWKNFAPNETLPSCSLHPDYKTPVNHIKPPKPKPLNPSVSQIPHPVTL